MRRGLGRTASIDNYLHTHQEDKELVALGKTAIAICIARAEAQSHFFNPASQSLRLQDRVRRPTPSIMGQDLNKSWYAPLAERLFSGVLANDVEAVFRNVTFVVFNYDRCLEQFLYMAVQDYFSIDEARAAEVVSNARFIHPYGTLGGLPWQIAKSSTPLPFGSLDGIDYWALGANLRTFTEAVRDSLGHRVRMATSEADFILFLGFGYLEQNVTLLRPPANRHAARIIGTAYDIYDDDRETIRTIMGQFAHDRNPMIQIDPGSCRDLFDHYRITLGFS